jgi:hypothetical protein
MSRRAGQRALAGLGKLRQGRLLHRGSQVLASLSIEGRSLRGVVLEVVRQGVWVQLATFPAPVLFPHHCVRVA